jgi:hypothetical protein
MTGWPMSESAEWVPAFEGQRPPFGPGHELSVRHGAYSPRKYEPLARELVENVLADDHQAFTHAPAFRPALWAWARAEAQVQLLTEYLAGLAEAANNGVGDLDDERVRAAYLLLHRAEMRAQSGRSRLGMDPLSRARLGRDVAAGQADLASALTRIAERDRREGERSGN